MFSMYMMSLRAEPGPFDSPYVQTSFFVMLASFIALVALLFHVTPSRAWRHGMLSRPSVWLAAAVAALTIGVLANDLTFEIGLSPPLWGVAFAALAAALTYMLYCLLCRQWPYRAPTDEPPKPACRTQLGVPPAHPPRAAGRVVPPGPPVPAHMPPLRPGKARPRLPFASRAGSRPGKKKTPLPPPRK